VIFAHDREEAGHDSLSTATTNPHLLQQPVSEAFCAVTARRVVQSSTS
jgi:hypothetical protein